MRGLDNSFYNLPGVNAGITLIECIKFNGPFEIYFESLRYTI